MIHEKDKNTNVSINKIGIMVVLVYIACIVLFFFLAGEQLHFRNSRGNVELLPVENGAIELVQGATVEQTFSAPIQRLEGIAVQVGTAYRVNAGKVTIELYNALDNSLIAKNIFDAAAITEGQLLDVRTNSPIENLYNVPLRIVMYADSPVGQGITPLINLSQKNSDSEATLFYNGGSADGVLCMQTYGTDYIWIGRHYWGFAAIGLAMLVLWIFLENVWQKKGKRSYVINAILAVKKYEFLIRQLVSRDFKTKYKRSVLGVFWSFLNPLLMMSVQYVVFSTIFNADIANYPVYLLIGIVAFNFFSEACSMSLMSILGNAGLITKVYMPKYIYPFTRVLSSVVNLSISLLPLILMILVTGVKLKVSALLTFYFLLCLVIFSLGLGFLLAASMVFFRDTQFLWNVISMIWMYATPIFYPESILPEQFRFILKINPLYYFIRNMRVCILDGVSPEPIVYMQCMLLALGMLVFGSWVFKKTQDKFVLYL